MDTSESEPQPPPPPEEDPATVAARVKRRLLMGAGLLLAIASLYSGLLGAPPLLQVALASLAAACVFQAFRTSEG